MLESEALAMKVALSCVKTAGRLKLPYIFKASFDKANRSSLKGRRGPGLKEGLEILARVKSRFQIPVLTDVHESVQVADVAAVVDIIQIPAFLCRQTDLLLAAGKSGCVVNIKKGQFMAPGNMLETARKVESTGNRRILLTERGVSFGYQNLVVDFTSLPAMRQFGYPVVFDATHSVQQPGGLGDASGGRGEYVGDLARAAAAVGVDGYFFEVHPDPAKAWSDGPNMIPLKKFESLLKDVLEIDSIRRHQKTGRKTGKR